MSTVPLNLDTDNLKRLYESGLSLNQIAQKLGIGAMSVRKYLLAAGVPIRSRAEGQALRPHGRTEITVNEVVALYNAGMSEKAIEKKIGLSRPAIRNRLLKAGIKPRNRSESMYLRMSQTSPEERKRLASAAHDAVRGTSQTEEHRLKVAAGVERNCVNVSRTEIIVGEMLAERGFTFTRQKAVGRYNVDIALHEVPIAVEIFGGHWHCYGSHAARFRRRTDYILDQGWSVVCIWVSRQHPLEVSAIEHIVSLAEMLRRGEPVERREQMILGNGESTTIGECQLNGIPVVPGPNPRDNATGRYAKRTRQDA
jgi:very-short-patch-repair endonuclease